MGGFPHEASNLPSLIRLPNTDLAGFVTSARVSVVNASRWRERRTIRRRSGAGNISPWTTTSVKLKNETGLRSPTHTVPSWLPSRQRILRRQSGLNRPELHEFFQEGEGLPAIGIKHLASCLIKVPGPGGSVGPLRTSPANRSVHSVHFSWPSRHNVLSPPPNKWSRHG